MSSSENCLRARCWWGSGGVAARAGNAPRSQDHPRPPVAAAAGGGPVAIPTTEHPAKEAAPRRTRARNDPSGGFAGIAALGAAFAGFVCYGRNPDLLATAIAAGLTFLGALILLHVLHFLFRIAVVAGKIAIPVTAILLVGNALDWSWAETATDWLLAAGGKALSAAQHAWAGWRAA
jgi:hypothetical protein